MVKKEKKKNLNLYSNDFQTNEILSNLKLQNKVYFRLISALQILGNFDQNVNVEIFEVIQDEENKKIILSCFVKNDKLFLFHGISTDRKDLLLINEISNDYEKKYDIALAKKFELTPDNINLTLMDKEYDFKFGRLITDNINFYSLFLGNNISYQIVGDFDKNISSHLISELNKLEDIPTLQKYISIFEKIILDENMDFSNLKISAYKNFMVNCLLEFGKPLDSQKDQKVLTLKK